MSPRLATLSTVVVLSLLVLVGTARVAGAAPCDPDNKCTGCADTSERLKCKFDRMAGKGKETMELLETSNVLSPAQVQGLGKAKERMDRERGRVKSEDFRVLTKKRSANCQLVEFSGDGDGVCDPKTEQCAEVLDDSIGDDDGICDPMKGKKREACVQICDEEALLVDESVIDDDAAIELEGMYDTLTSHAEEVGETIPETASLVRALSSVQTDDPCVLQTTLQRHSFDAYKKARWAAVGSRAATDVAERFCDYVSGGFFAFSVSVACVAGESIALAMATWWEVVDDIEATLDALTLDAAIACAAEAADGADQTGAMIQSVQTSLGEVRAQNAEILRLIKIPPGQREEFPTPEPLP
ncbi:MAG: hypothetical protein ABFS41_14390 [Myxococcota bacterium]